MAWGTHEGKSHHRFSRRGFSVQGENIPRLPYGFLSQMLWYIYLHLDNCLWMFINYGKCIFWLVDRKHIYICLHMDIYLNVYLWENLHLANFYVKCRCVYIYIEINIYNIGTMHRVFGTGKITVFWI